MNGKQDGEEQTVNNVWNKIRRRMQGPLKTRCSAAVFISVGKGGKKDGLVSDMDIDENSNAVDPYYVFSGSLDGAAGGIGTL